MTAYPCCEHCEIDGDICEVTEGYVKAHGTPCDECGDSGTVTITISRNCAEYFAERACTNDRACFTEVGGCVALDCHLEQACRAELEVER